MKNLIRRLFLSLFIGGLIVSVLLFGTWFAVNRLWVSDVIRSRKPITPEIELRYNKNQVDTIYIYKLKK